MSEARLIEIVNTEPDQDKVWEAVEQFLEEELRNEKQGNKRVSQ